MRQAVSVHWMTREVIGPGYYGVAGVLQCRVEGRAVGGVMRELLAEAHDNLLWVVAEDIVAGLRRHKLGKAVDMLVLRLLGIGRMDTGRRASGPWATTTPGHGRFRAWSHRVGSPWSTMRRNLG